ncbi:MAG TPA: UbiD family decarboxylase [Xanthobacteraceae bacterium]
MGHATAIDFDKYRLRSFVTRLIELGEVEIHDRPAPLTGLSTVIEGTDKAVLFKKAGPEQVELVAKTAGNRKRIAAAFETSEEKLYDEYFKRLANPQPLVEVPSADAPVHAIKITGEHVDLTKLPFHPQHAYDGSCYLSSAIDYSVDPATGRRNVGCRRLSLRNRTEAGTNVTAPSDLKRIYTACVARGEKLPVTFTVGAHPLDFFAATTRQPGDELALVASFRAEPAPVVKSLTNDILVPADAEMTLEGYLDERGYVEPEGPYGEYMGYYGAIHMDPVFHCTAITMRSDVLHHTLLHGSAFVLDQTDSANITAMRTEADAMRILKSCVREPVAVYLRQVSGGANTLRVSIKQRTYGEARSAIAALFGGIMRLKHVYVFDEDIDIHDDRQVEWALGTRFQADQDLIVLEGMLGMTMDPSLNGRRTGAKSGFDCTKPFGRDGQIPLTRCAAKVFKGPARYQNVEQALAAAPMFFSDIVESLGSEDGREVACALDELRQSGRLGRDRDGRYYLHQSKPGLTGIVGELYRDPNAGA